MEKYKDKVVKSSEICREHLHPEIQKISIPDLINSQLNSFETGAGLSIKNL